MARELRSLRGHAGEPLPDLLLRVMRVTGLEVEAGLGPAALAAQQQEALHAFLDLASEFTELDGRLTLGAFLTRLRDIERFDVSVDLEVSGPRDAVQLLTVHKAKGLEFPVVFVPFLSAGAFPGGRARSQWPTSPSTVPWRLRDDVTPDLASFPIDGETPRKKDYDAYLAVLKEYDALEHRRLAYVAFTRAEVALFASGHWWGLTQNSTRGPHAFLQGVREACLDGAGAVAHWADPPEQGATNPHVRDAVRGVAWPAPLDPQVQERTRAVAEAVRAVDAVQGALPGLGSGFSAAGLTPSESAEVHEWDLLTAALLEEEQARHASSRVVALPEALSASLLMRALAEPEAVAQDIVRPMPRPPAPAARRGTQFHAWVETRYGQQSLIDPEDLPGAADADILSEEELLELQAAFERSAYAQRTPVAVEAPFALVVAGRVVNGRIDAVFASSDPGVTYEVVDWKTGSARHLDPMQLAVYRLAWAARAGVPVEQVAAAFLVVATGDILRPDTSAQVALLRSL
jgi:DNA helicase-2/ATP-dependent DNA helicase PcrA